MAYKDKFKFADDYILHTNTIARNIPDAFIQQRYVGFVTISAVTVFELAIKDIMINFAEKKHRVFGSYIESSYARINGRISLKNLKEEHISKFGDKYLTKFMEKLEQNEIKVLNSRKRSIKSSYGNIVTWRHAFVHEGIIAANASYEEAVRAYEDGKEVIHVLAAAMTR